jgi:polynucleotide 5'-kinase involved in rRNA processing
MIEKEVGRVLKYHEAVAAGADCVVALQRATELEAILGLLGGVCPHMYREPVDPDAKDRKLGQRREFRKKRYRAYFENGESLKFELSGLIGADWAPDPLKRQQYPEPGTVIGLLNNQDFCLGIGLVEKILPGHVMVFAPPCDPQTVARLKLGKIRIDRDKGFVEMRPEQPQPGA